MDGYDVGRLVVGLLVGVLEVGEFVGLCVGSLVVGNDVGLMLGEEVGLNVG